MKKYLPHFRTAVKRAFREFESKGDRPNFIFCGAGFLHIASFNAYARKAKEEGIKMCGVVCNITPLSRSNKQFDASYVTELDESDFIYLEHGTDYRTGLNVIQQFLMLARVVVDILKMRSNSGLQSSAKDSFMLFYPPLGFPPVSYWDAVMGESGTITWVPIEEGIGVYTSISDDEVKTIFALEDGKSPDLAIKAKKSFKEIINNKLEEMIKAKVSVGDILLFGKGDAEEVVLSERNSVFLRHSFERIALKKDVPSVDYSGSVILVATNLFDEMGFIDFEIDLYRDLVSILRGYGIRVVLRPHPRKQHPEAYQELDVIMDRYDSVSIEAILAASSVKPLAVIGIFSTALVSASALWGIKSISLSSLYNKEIEKANLFPSSHLRQKNFLSAERVFSNYVDAPKTYVELKELIESFKLVRH